MDYLLPFMSAFAGTLIAASLIMFIFKIRRDTYTHVNEMNALLIKILAAQLPELMGLLSPSPDSLYIGLASSVSSDRPTPVQTVHIVARRGSATKELSVNISHRPDLQDILGRLAGKTIDTQGLTLEGESHVERPRITRA